ncbi:MAG: signal peptidase I [Methylobacteriaceae bacterium]|nr:signal peptidase I [Methylobacteriaceae bacterium]
MSVSSKPTESTKKGGFVEFIRVIIEAVLIALVIRTILFQPFNIPSSSMEPNLLIGDYLFISKYSYGYSRHSFPFSPPLFSGRVWASEPKRGDVVVFKKPSDTNQDYIKRVIGLPGDRLQMINGIIHINGVAFKRELKQTRPEKEWSEQYQRWYTYSGVSYYTETNPEGVSYLIREALGDRGENDNTREYVVPEGHYFMMGDNRDRSEDSRGDVGFVPFDNLEGRAEILFFSIEPQRQGGKLWQIPSRIRWSRIFNRIK